MIDIPKETPSKDVIVVVAVYSPTDDEVAIFQFDSAGARESFLHDIADSDSRIVVADIPRHS